MAQTISVFFRLPFVCPRTADAETAADRQVWFEAKLGENGVVTPGSRCIVRPPEGRPVLMEQLDLLLPPLVLGGGQARSPVGFVAGRPAWRFDQGHFLFWAPERHRWCVAKAGASQVDAELTLPHDYLCCFENPLTGEREGCEWWEAEPGEADEHFYHRVGETFSFRPAGAMDSDAPDLEISVPAPLGRAQSNGRIFVDGEGNEALDFSGRIYTALVEVPAEDGGENEEAEGGEGRTETLRFEMRQTSVTGWSGAGAALTWNPGGGGSGEGPWFLTAAGHVFAAAALPLRESDGPATFDEVGAFRHMQARVYVARGPSVEVNAELDGILVGEGGRQWA